MASAPRMRMLNRRPPPLVDPRDGISRRTRRAPRAARCSRSPATCWPRSVCRRWRWRSSCSSCCRRCCSASPRCWRPCGWNKFSSTARGSGIGAILFLVFLLALAWFGGRKLFRLVESSFWSLNAMAIQPGYVAFREGLLHLSGRMTARRREREAARARARGGLGAVGTGASAPARARGLARLAADALGRHARRSRERPIGSSLPALANATAVGAAYIAVAASGVGDRGRHDAATTPAHRFRHATISCGRGASRISPTSTSSASGSAFGSAADAPARGATSDFVAALAAARRGASSRAARRDRRHRRPDRRGHVGGIRRAAGNARSVPTLEPLMVACRAITTSTSWTAPTRRASTCRPVRRSGCDRCARCRRWRRCRDAHTRGRDDRAAARGRHARSTRSRRTRTTSGVRRRRLAPPRARSTDAAWTPRLPDGAAAGERGRTGHHRAELERRDPLLVHERARASSRSRRCRRSRSAMAQYPASVLDHRPASSHRRASQARATPSPNASGRR